MKLYYAPGACSLSPHIILQETGLKHSLVKTDIRAKKTEDGGDFLAKNPHGYVPALELDDGTMLTEGPAIIQYLAGKAPEKHLTPAVGSLDHIKMLGWLNFVSTEMHKGFSPLFNPAMPEEAKKLARDKLAQRFAVLDKHLATNQYLCGATYSLPDAYAFVTLNWTKPTNIDLTPYKNIMAYHARVGARPAVQAAMKAEGLMK
jgi:glutathione S-transferase